MFDPETFTYVANGLRLNLCAWGDPAAPPLVLIHGVRDHARAWDRVAAAFAGRHRVLAPDLRGHGDSAWATGGVYPTEAYLLDLAELTRALPPFALIGHSLGGNIALRFAALFPQKVLRVVAIEGLSHSPRSVAETAAAPIERRLRDWIARQQEIAARPPRRYASLAEAAARILEAQPRLGAEFAAHLARTGTRRNADATFSFKFDPALRVFPPVEMDAPDAARLWSLVACPALLVYGAQSWASHPVQDGRATHFRDAEVATLPEAGHWAHHDAPDAFLSLTRRFLGE